MNYLTFSREFIKRNYNTLISFYKEIYQLDDLLLSLRNDNKKIFYNLSKVVVDGITGYNRKSPEWEWKINFNYDGVNSCEDLTYCINHTQEQIEYDILIDIVSCFSDHSYDFGIYLFIKDNKITLHISIDTDDDWVQLFLKEYNNYDEMMSHLTDEFILLETLSSTLNYNNRNIEC